MDRTAYKILEIVASMSTEGENLVVNKAEIISLVGVDVTVEMLDKNIEALEVNDMLSVLYSDDSMYCISVRPKGKLIAEKNKKAEEAAIAAAQEEKERLATMAAMAQALGEEELPTAAESRQNTVIDVRRFAVICAVSSFLGGFLAAMITFIVTLFK